MISGLLKLCEHLEKDSLSDSVADITGIQSAILDLEQQWHGLWLISLEQQYLLEELISNRKVRKGSATSCTCVCVMFYVYFFLHIFTSFFKV